MRRIRGCGETRFLKRSWRSKRLTINQFLAWCDQAGFQALQDIEPITALLATLAYTFARISAVIGLTVADYFPSGKRWMIRFREKGGKEKELPVHHQLEQVLDDYLLKTKLSEEPAAPLFPAARTGVLSRRPINRIDTAEMSKRRLRQAGLPEHYSAHSFRAAGVTNFLEKGGSLEVAQRIAGHADSRTTKLYDRRAEKLLVEDMERIRY